MIRPVLVGVLISPLLLGNAPCLQAGGCVVRFRHSPVKVIAVQNHHAVHHAVADYVPIPIPYYTSHYGGQNTNDPAKDLLMIEAFKALAQTNKAILDRLERLERGGPQPGATPPGAVRPGQPSSPSPMPPADQAGGSGDGGGGADPFNPQARQEAPAPFVQQAQRYCASCHTGATAKGGLKLFDQGQLAQLKPEQVGDIIEHVVNGTMPPPSSGQKMSAEERLAFIRSMTGK